MGPRFRGDDNNELRSQSSLAPLALMGPAQRAISLTTNLARYSGVLRSAAGMVTPMLLNRSRTAGVSTASLTALARRRTISSGVPFGNESEPQLPQSRPARPSSCAVASCSRPGARSSPSVAIRLDRAALNLRQRGRNLLGDEVDASAHQILHRRRRAASTCVILVPMAASSSTAHTCMPEPAPAEPHCIFAWLALA